MALVKKTLETQMLSLIKEMRTKTENSDEEFARKFATMIDTYIRSAQVAPGIPVATAGGPTAQTGATTGTGSLM